MNLVYRLVLTVTPNQMKQKIKLLIERLPSLLNKMKRGLRNKNPSEFYIRNYDILKIRNFIIRNEGRKKTHFLNKKK
jgi:hypothetical protein